MEESLLWTGRQKGWICRHLLLRKSPLETAASSSYSHLLPKLLPWICPKNRRPNQLPYCNSVFSIWNLMKLPCRKTTLTCRWCLRPQSTSGVVCLGISPAVVQTGTIMKMHGTAIIYCRFHRQLRCFSFYFSSLLK